MAGIANRKGFIIAVAAVAVLGVGALLVYQLVASGFHRGPDHMFGDQHLKTSMALLELHRTRQGSYPETLRELEYLGNWDQIALNSVRYCPSADRKTYFIDVTRGWVGKPSLTYPPEFWRGTGYRAETVKACP